MKHARADYDRIQDPAGKIAEDEPVFLLRAKDKLAPDLVQAWGLAMIEIGGDHQLAQLALDHADRMREWQAVNGCKVADL